MSIVVRNVTKLYGEQKALDDISFEVKTGEIVGFLGPNGAGKSTMMKIITGFIPASSGEVEVNGLGNWMGETPTSPVRRLALVVGRSGATGKLCLDSLKNHALRTEPSLLVARNIHSLTRESGLLHRAFPENSPRNSLPFTGP